jgi:hypothetical protein
MEGICAFQVYVYISENILSREHRIDTMDAWIVFVGVVSFLTLLCSLPIVFRVVSPLAAVPWFIREMAMIGVLCVGLWSLLCFKGVVYPANVDSFLFGAIASLGIYVLLSVIYLFGIFGTIESAITLRLLSIIAQSGQKGIHQNAIISSYNRRTIVMRRVDRLMYMGEIVIVGNYYRLSKRASYAIWRERVFRVLNAMFPAS